MKRTAAFLALAALAGVTLILFCRSDDTDAKDAEEIDFTRMNTTMRMSQLYRLMANPNEFEGKTLRVSGVFLTGIDPNDGKRHFGCQLGYAGGCACCSPGGILEFEPPSGLEWPKDFPRIESNIVLTGRLKMVQSSDSVQQQKGFTIPCLVHAQMTPLGQ